MAQIEFVESDFSKCKYNLFEVDKVWVKYPELKIMYAEVSSFCFEEEWKSFITPEQMMKYIVFCYHKPSPLIKRIAELRERKTQALLLSGIDIHKLQKNEASKKIIANILLSRHEFTTRLALHFLKNENNLLWTEYCHLLDILEDAMYQMANPNEDEDGKKLSSVEIAGKKTAIYKGIQQYRTDLNLISDKLMQGDLEMQSFMSSQLIQMKRSRLITPEDFVKMSEEELIETFRQHNLAVA